MRNETKKIDNKVLRFTIGSIWTNLQSYSMDDIAFDSQDGRSSPQCRLVVYYTLFGFPSSGIKQSKKST